MITPRILKGFRDMMPNEERLRLHLQKKLQTVFEGFGCVPIDTPMLEYTEVLLGKGGGETDKQVYHFMDHGGRDIALRFDLTVPFARFMAMHHNELQLPFKRYHISKVFRGENTQRGRYREFMQCDFDIVGSDSASSDFEILSIMAASFKALQIDNISIKVSHRGLFNQLLERLEIRQQSVEILRLVDKLRKIGQDKVLEGLTALSNQTAAEDILAFIQPCGSNALTLENMIRLAGGESDASRRLFHVIQLCDNAGIDADIVIDPSITRGLDYYTGIVFETFLSELPEIGSVCSGGRYNDLAALYSKQELPGVGASIGLDRLLAGLDELNSIPDLGPQTDALIFCVDESCLANYHRLAADLRAQGLKIEVYPEAKKLPKQFAFAEKRNIPFGILFGPDEKSTGTANIKNLINRESMEQIPLQEIGTHLKSTTECNAEKSRKL